MLTLALAPLITFAASAVPPVDPLTEFEAWAHAQGTAVTAPACHVPVEGLITCYGLADTGVLVGVANQDATTLAVPTLNRDAELAVRACVDAVGPLTTVAFDIVMRGDNEDLIEAQAVCDTAFAQLEVEDSALASALRECVSEINLSLSGLAVDFLVDGVLEQSVVDAIYTPLVAANYLAVHTLLAGGPATCVDDVEPL